jgi:hypothetical protein
MIGRFFIRKRTIFFLFVLAGFTVMFMPVTGLRAQDEEASIFSWGFQERIRQEYLRNGFDMNNDFADDRNHIRLRTQLWFSIKPMEDLEFYIKLNNEHRHFLKPERDLEFEQFIDELIFESLYIKASNIAGSPVSVTLGRQNIMLGEGFLYMDGNPLDGSRTAYMNAVKVVVQGENRSLMVHALSNPQKDQYLPVINARDYRYLIESDEKGWGTVYTDTSRPWAKMDGYYYYKIEEESELRSVETRLHTIGARLNGTLLGNFDYAAEAAYQTGSYGGVDRTGLGGYVHVTFSPSALYEPEFTIGTIYLSGDNGETPEYEGWDPLYSRWPKWSELYIYTLVTEHGVAYWDNLIAPYGRFSLRFNEHFQFMATLFEMRAPERPLVYSSGIFGTGLDRGMLSKVRLNWKWNKYVRGHLEWEQFSPGDYYADGSDSAHFLRWEFNFIY